MGVGLRAARYQSNIDPGETMSNIWDRLEGCKPINSTASRVLNNPDGDKLIASDEVITRDKLMSENIRLRQEIALRDIEIDVLMDAEKGLLDMLIRLLDKRPH